MMSHVKVKHLNRDDAGKAIRYATTVVEVGTFAAVTSETVKALFDSNPNIFVVFFNPRDYSDMLRWTQEDYVAGNYIFEHNREKLEYGTMGYYREFVPFIQSRDVPYGEVIACGPQAYTIFRIKLDRAVPSPASV